mmetsp:Transcript_77622/g.251346  ORF Transcript_77622/g.251346 Transcript_77622/m.251346 type:complete len:260 (+) Transcript_77622:1793-2572(+)
MLRVAQGIAETHSGPSPTCLLCCRWGRWHRFSWRCCNRWHGDVRWPRPADRGSGDIRESKPGAARPQGIAVSSGLGEGSADASRLRGFATSTGLGEGSADAARPQGTASTSSTGRGQGGADGRDRCEGGGGKRGAFLALARPAGKATHRNTCCRHTKTSGPGDVGHRRRPRGDLPQHGRGARRRVLARPGGRAVGEEDRATQVGRRSGGGTHAAPTWRGLGTPGADRTQEEFRLQQEPVQLRLRRGERQAERTAAGPSR